MLLYLGLEVPLVFEDIWFLCLRVIKSNCI